MFDTVDRYISYHIASYNYWKEFVVIHQFIANFLDKFELLSFFILLAALIRKTIHYNNIINLLTKFKMKKYYSSIYLSFISSAFLFFVSCCLENLRFLGTLSRLMCVPGTQTTTANFWAVSHKSLRILMIINVLVFL